MCWGKADRSILLLRNLGQNRVFKTFADLSKHVEKIDKTGLAIVLIGGSALAIGAVYGIKSEEKTYGEHMSETLGEHILSKIGEGKLEKAEEAVQQFEGIRAAGNENEVKILERTIGNMKEKCGSCNGMTNRLKAVRDRWKESLQGKPVSDLKWRPKPRKPVLKRSPQKVARSRC